MRINILFQSQDKSEFKGAEEESGSTSITLTIYGRRLEAKDPRCLVHHDNCFFVKGSNFDHDKGKCRHHHLLSIVLIISKLLIHGVTGLKVPSVKLCPLLF